MSCLLICLPLLEKATEMRDQVVTEMMNRRERKVRSFAPTHLPFYLTSEEGGRNSIRGFPMSTVEKPGERNITCHKNVLLSEKAITRNISHLRQWLCYMCWLNSWLWNARSFELEFQLGKTLFQLAPAYANLSRGSIYRVPAKMSMWKLWKTDTDE